MNEIKDFIKAVEKWRRHHSDVFCTSPKSQGISDRFSMVKHLCDMPEYKALKALENKEGWMIDFSESGLLGWVDWGGGLNPCPDEMVECKARDGSFWSGLSCNFEWYWGLGGHPDDIIAYRVLKEGCTRADMLDERRQEEEKWKKPTKKPTLLEWLRNKSLGNSKYFCEWTEREMDILRAVSNYLKEGAK